MGNKNIINFTLILTVLLIGCLFRLYNINFDDFWYDEILTFTVANPNLSISESFEIQTEIDNTPYLGSLILRFVFQVFGYKSEFARYLPCIFSIASIFTITYLAKSLKNNSAYVFTSFLISSNIFLISYSQELRIYSMLFFFSSLSLIFFIKLVEKKNSSLNLFFFILFSSLQVFSHPISFLIIISYMFYIFIDFFIFKKKNTSLYVGLLITIILCFLYFSFYFYNFTIHSWDWISQPKLKFFTNFYFSNFFGSRLVGIIFLFTFVYLLYQNRKLFFRFDKISIFLIVIFFSYLLPIVFGYLYKPILVSRYIIFVVASITILISYLIFEIQNKKIRNSLIVLLSVITIGNHFTEQTVKQFFETRQIHKPEFKKAIQTINESNVNNYYFKINSYPASRPAPGSPKTIFALIKYFEHLNKGNKNNLKYIDIKKTSVKQTWIVCLTDLHGHDCTLPAQIKTKKIIKNINLNRLNLKLINL